VAGGVRAAARRGIVLLNPDAVERVADVDVVAIDKTGTLTEGGLRIAEAASTEAMRRAAAVERFSRHPVAEAIVEAAPDDGATVEDVETHPGRGVVGTVEGERVAVGAPALFRALDWTVPEELVDAPEGDVVSLVGWAGRARERVLLEDRPRDGWQDAVARLADDGRRVVVVTGDDDVPASLREHAAVDRVFTGVPPEAKAVTVRRLGDGGGVLMVGDGSNDAPALAAADVGVAVGDASALAADAADVVVLDGGLGGVTDAVALAAGTRRRVRENLGWALGYNAIALPVAALGYLNPLVAAVAMASSSLLVVANSARGELD
jgi:Cu2+-exporting ATPase